MNSEQQHKQKQKQHTRTKEVIINECLQKWKQCPFKESWLNSRSARDLNIGLKGSFSWHTLCALYCIGLLRSALASPVPLKRRCLLWPAVRLAGTLMPVRHPSDGAGAVIEATTKARKVAGNIGLNGRHVFQK